MNHPTDDYVIFEIIVSKITVKLQLNNSSEISTLLLIYLQFQLKFILLFFHMPYDKCNANYPECWSRDLSVVITMASQGNPQGNRYF